MYQKRFICGNDSLRQPIKTIVTLTGVDKPQLIRGLNKSRVLEVQAALMEDIKIKSNSIN